MVVESRGVPAGVTGIAGDRVWVPPMTQKYRFLENL